MPITIFQPTGPIITPGIAIHVGTNHAPWDPLLDWHWQFTIVGADGETPCLRATGDADPTSAFLGQWAITPLNVNVQDGTTLQDGGFCHLLVELQNEIGVTQESLLSPQRIYDATTGLPKVIEAQSTTVQGGFTEQDRTTLNTTATTTDETNQLSLAINDATQAHMVLAGQPIQVPIGEILSSNLLDFFHDRSLSGGVTCEPVRYNASLNALYGVTVVIDSYPSDWKFGTPDDSWGFHDLATLRFVRAGVVLERHGIHTLTHSVSPCPGLPFPWATGALPTLQPPDFHIWVDWAEGVCGELIGQVLP